MRSPEERPIAGHCIAQTHYDVLHEEIFLPVIDVDHGLPILSNLRKVKRTGQIDKTDQVFFQLQHAKPQTGFEHARSYPLILSYRKGDFVDVCIYTFTNRTECANAADPLSQESVGHKLGKLR